MTDTTPKHAKAASLSPKVTAATAAVALVTIVGWAIEASTGIDIPVAVEGAAGVLFTFAAGYLVTDPARH